MSYSMSPPHKPAPSPYPPAPYQNATSPTNGLPYPPPAKRPRLSPDPRSPPSGSPVYANQPGALGGYGNPYAPSPVQTPYSPNNFTPPPQSSFHTPQPYAPQPMQWPTQSQPPTPNQPPPQMSPPAPANTGAQLMPPPPKPNKEDKDERMNVDDYADMLTGSGVSLKDEENYVQNLWNNRHGAGESFGTTQSSSFGSSTVSPNNSFNILTQGTSFATSSTDGPFAGTMGRPISQDDIEAEARRKREHAATALNTQKQNHLNNQFLLANCVRKRIHTCAYEHGVKLDVTGVYVRNTEPQTQVLVNGAGSEGIVATESRAESKVDVGVPYDHILSLVSLATGERLRSLMDKAYGLARARQYGDHGRVVPPEFASIATGEGKRLSDKVVPESVTGSQWDKQHEPAALTNGDAHASGTPEAPQPTETITFQGTLNTSLRALAEGEKRAEKERVQRREARKRKAENAGTGDDTATDHAAEPTPTLEALAPAKMTKKELNKKKQETANTTEAQLFNQSNQTAAMMALGGKKNRYSWMTGGMSNMPTNRFAKPPAPGSGSGTPTLKQEPSTQTPLSAGLPKEPEREPTWGDWREDSVDGRGIQLRDWALVLERDGRERRALQKTERALRGTV